jgi:hypothetical protein
MKRNPSTTTFVLWKLGTPPPLGRGMDQVIGS